MPLPYARISVTRVPLPDGRVLEVYITLHAPLPMATSWSGGEDYWPPEDPPRVANHVYQTLVWYDVANEITDWRMVQDLTVLEEA